jgi:hypothetical protein
VECGSGGVVVPLAISNPATELMYVLNDAQVSTVMFC